MSRIGGSARVRDELTAALAEGRGVTAKVRWITSRHDGEDEGRARWIHCTPLLGQGGTVGVWMIVIVDDEVGGVQRKFRVAPPVDQEIGRKFRGEGNMLSPFSGRSRRASFDGEEKRMGSEAGSSRPSTSYAGSLGPGGAQASLESFSI
jgi:hypothetical protein